MATQVCTSNEDCRANEYCFGRTEWYESQLPWNNNLTLPGCACNTFYAWTGQNCDTLSASSKVVVAISSLNCFLLLWCLFNLFVVFQQFRRRDKGIKLHAGMTTTMISIVAGIGLLGWNSLTLFASTLATTENFVFKRYAKSDPYRGRFNGVGFIFASVGIVAMFLATIVISLMWVELSEIIGGKRFGEKITNLKQYKKFTYFFIVAFAIVGGLSALIARVAKLPTIYPLTFIPFQVIMIVTYTVGAYRFSSILNSNSRKLSQKVTVSNSSPKTLKTSSKASIDSSLDLVDDETLKTVNTKIRSNSKSESDPIKRIIVAVRDTTIYIVLLLLISLVSGVTQSVVDIKHSTKGINDGVQNSLPPDKLWGAYKVAYFVQVSAFSFSLVVITQYLRSNARRK